MVAQTEAQLGPIDFLVNNAGSSGVIGPIWATHPDDWWRTIKVSRTLGNSPSTYAGRYGKRRRPRRGAEFPRRPVRGQAALPGQVGAARTIAFTSFAS